MGNVLLPAQTLIPVRLALLVGATVGDRPNFMLVGGGGSMSSDPPMVALPIRHERYTLKGIMQNGTFSVNIPSVDLVKEADYCGIVSGANADKAKDCGFSVFYGKLSTAPMVEQCPANMECSMVYMLRTNSHMIVIGRIEATYMSEQYLSNGQPDYSKLSPLLWFAGRSEYIAVGKNLGQSNGVGRRIR